MQVRKNMVKRDHADGNFPYSGEKKKMDENPSKIGVVKIVSGGKFCHVTAQAKMNFSQQISLLDLVSDLPM